MYCCCSLSVATIMPNYTILSVSEPFQAATVSQSPSNVELANEGVSSYMVYLHHV